MRICFLFRPHFLEWPLAMAREYHRRSASFSCTGIVRGKKRFYEAVVSHREPRVQPVYELARLERDWIETSYEKNRRKTLENRLGPQTLNRVVMAGRKLGWGWIDDCVEAETGSMKRSGQSEFVRRYVVGMLCFLFEYFERESPDVVFADDVGPVEAFASAQVAQALGIAFRKLTPARLQSRMLIDHTVEDRFVPVAETFRRSRTDFSLIDSWREEAEGHLEEFRSRPRIPDYSRTFSRQAQRQRSIGQLLTEVRKTVWAFPKLFLRGERRELHEPTSWERRKAKLRVAWNALRLRWRNPFLAPGELPDRPFVYFPLHVSPEVSTAIYSPLHANQRAVVELVSKQLPLDYELVVKEAPAMVGRRKPDFYESLGAMPGVTLASPATSPFELIQASAFTCTITGTAGWEAMQLGTPVLILGEHYPFLVLGEGFVHCPELTRLDQAIETAEEVEPASEEVLIRYIASLLKHSFKRPAALNWGGFDRSQWEDFDGAISQFCDRLLESLNAPENIRSSSDGFTVGR